MDKFEGVNGNAIRRQQTEPAKRTPTAELVSSAHIRLQGLRVNLLERQPRIQPKNRQDEGIKALNGVAHKQIWNESGIKF